MRILFFDTETTGNGERDRLLQLAIKERHVSAPIVNAIYKPPLPISYEAMAVHHITEKMTTERPSFLEATEYRKVKSLFEDSNSVSVAHNASFDLGMLSREDIVPVRTICTYKVAVALDTDGKMGKYQLQFLRYLLGLEITASAHDAWGDVVVLEGVFEHLLQKLTEKLGNEDAAIAEMISISKRPMLFTTLRFGKHKGKRLQDIAQSDAGYLTWLLGEKKKEPLGEIDWIYTLEYYLADSKKKKSPLPEYTPLDF